MAIHDDEKANAIRRQALMESGEVAQALESLDRSIQADPENSLLIRERAHVHLYLSDSQEARADFDATARLDSAVFPLRTGWLHSDLEYNAIGVTYWIENHRDLALSFWRYSTLKLASNRVAYTLAGNGGIETGLLLWFGANHEKNPADIALVRTFYEKRLASKSWARTMSEWPGLIVRFFLQQIDEHTLMEGSSDDRQHLCEAHLAIAVRARETSHHAAYRKHLALASSEKSPGDIYEFYNVLSWFLTRAEVKKSG